MVARAISLVDQALPESERLRSAPCTRGCAWCCHGVVDVTALEAAGILERHTGNLPWSSIEQRAALVSGLQDRQAVARRLQGLPCPLLGRDLQCTVYPRRPLVCRSVRSVERNAEPCRQAQNGSAGAAEQVTLDNSLNIIWRGVFTRIRERWPDQVADLAVWLLRLRDRRERCESDGG
jgi:Fe-S-cluster containining protein